MKEYKDKKFLSKVAILYYLKNLTQQEIAKKLSISRTKVSRYLDKARKEKIVDIKINIPEEAFDEIEYSLEEKYKLKECIVVPTCDYFDETAKEMSVELVRILQRILSDGDYLGVHWGNTLKSIVENMEVEEKIKINVVPMMGGLGKIGTGVQTNLIAKNIADRFGGVSYIMNTPAVVDNKVIREVVKKDSSLKEILGLIDKIKVAVIGISFTDKDSTLIQMGVFGEKDFERLRTMGVVGDINLTFMDKEGKFIETCLDERIIRTPFDKIKKIPNIIGIAFGEKKVIPLKAALSANLMNILITDHNTAKELL